MKVFAAVMIVSAVWLLLAFALAGCGGRKAATAAHAGPPSLPGAGAAPWMWEQHGTVVSLGQKAVVPPGHPISKVVSARSL
ncbi:MAG TPA: hypothetical protein VMR23_13760 [Candidatus Limnocylindria bacterium]|nr:hypothetical protein [Candidatus Limnocylindria bacterium]